MMCIFLGFDIERRLFHEKVTDDLSCGREEVVLGEGEVLGELWVIGVSGFFDTMGSAAATCGAAFFG